jgi:hypothetical protein
MPSGPLKITGVDIPENIKTEKVNPTLHTTQRAS